MLPNIKNIQASWLTVGKQTAQLCLHAGANDFGSIMIEENVVSAAGAPHRFTAQGIQNSIKEAGFEPQLRNQRYEWREMPEHWRPLLRYLSGATVRTIQPTIGLRVKKCEKGSREMDLHQFLRRAQNRSARDDWFFERASRAARMYTRRTGIPHKACHSRNASADRRRQIRLCKRELPEAWLRLRRQKREGETIQRV